MYMPPIASLLSLNPAATHFVLKTPPMFVGRLGVSVLITTGDVALAEAGWSANRTTGLSVVQRALIEAARSRLG